MIQIIARRLIQSAAVLLAVSFLIFLLQSLTPGDAARTILGTGGTQADYRALRQQLGLDLPVWHQYLDYLRGALHGDLGHSFRTGTPVTKLLGSRLGTSLSLIVGATVVGTVVGVLLGTASAVWGGVLGKVVDLLSVMGLALPNFWLALVLVTVFAIRVHLLPAVGYTPFSQSPEEWARGLMLPVAAMSLGTVAAIAKTTRESMSAALAQPHIRQLRAAGVSRSKVIWKHALRNASVPILSVLNVVVLGSLAGTVLIESIFSMPGLGSLMVTSVAGGEVLVLQGVALTFALIVVVVNVAIDLAALWLHPKARGAR